MTPFYRLAKTVCNVFCTLAFRLEVHGEQNLPKSGGFILASNHVTLLDPVLIGVRIKRQLNFMAKAELFEKRFFGKLIRALGAFPVERGKGDSTAITTAVNTVEQGNVLAIFPEGHRSKDGNLQRFKSGAIVVAAQTGADVVPTCVYIENREKGVHFRSKIVVRYGNVIPNEQLSIDVSNPSTIKKASGLVREAVANLLEESK
ncbi:MAG: lysophospholipid acyltransferase family protein [Massiliimalia sp.]|jgi:1-acyl-sn-glycerol-3-phosphate acyltransferase